MEYKQIRKYVYLALILTTAPFLLLLRELDLSNSVLTILTLGSITGFIGAVLLFWQLLLGLRFISTKFSKDLVWFNGLHKKMGIYGTLLVFTHPFLKALSYSGSIKLVFWPDFRDPLWVEISYGRIAFFLLLVIWVTSAFFRKKLGFRLWKLIHFLAYPILFFVFLHAANIGTYLLTYPFLKAIWVLMSYIFYAIVIYRLAKFLGFGYARYKLLVKEQVEDVYIYTFEALGKNITPAVGQFCYIKLSKFLGEEHPFTVMESYPKENKLVFGIKAHGKYTKKLSRLQQGAEVLVDGPFGVYTLEGHNSMPKIILVGGIGITPFVDLVEKYGNENTYMFFANRTLSAAVKRDKLKQKLGNRYFDVVDKEKVEGPNIIQGFLNSEILQKSIPSEILNKAMYFICGSKPFYENYKKMLLSLNVPRNMIFYEEFGF